MSSISTSLDKYVQSVDETNKMSNNQDKFFENQPKAAQESFGEDFNREIKEEVKDNFTFEKFHEPIRNWEINEDRKISQKVDTKRIVAQYVEPFEFYVLTRVSTTTIPTYEFFRN